MGGSKEPAGVSEPAGQAENAGATHERIQTMRHAMRAMLSAVSDASLDVLRPRM